MMAAADDASSTVTVKVPVSTKKPKPWERDGLQIELVRPETQNGRSYSQVCGDEAQTPQLCLKIPKALLCKFYIEQDESNSYISLLNQSIVGKVVKVNEESSRVESGIAKRCSMAYHTYSTAKGGRTEYSCLDGDLHFFILEGELLQTQESSEVACEYVEAERWKNQHSYLNTVVDQLYLEIAETIASYENQLETLQEELDTTKECLHHAPEINHGKLITEVSPRQARRKFAQLKSTAEKALWFAKTFGLLPTCLNLKKISTGSPLKLSLTKEDSSSSSQATLQLPSEREKILQVLYLLDKFSVSDEFFHELTMLCPDLPKSYKVKQARVELNKQFSQDLHRVPGENPGVYGSFRESLIQDILQVQRKNPNVFPKEGEEMKVRVKVSGDGAAFSRSSNLILLSYSLLDLKDEVLAGKGNHTVAAVKAPEKYEDLSVALKPTFDEINGFVYAPNITVGDQTYKIELFLGGDYKFLLIVLGLNAANSRQACVWCTVCAEDRWDMTKSDHHWQHEKARTLDKIVQALTAKEKMGVKNPPLLDIPIDHVVIDELHLLLRITDVLLRCVINQAIEVDIMQTRSRDVLKGPNLQKTVECIRSCGITFRVWESEKKAGSKIDWTSLMGKDKKKLLAKFPLNFKEILPVDCCEAVTNLWMEFAQLYHILASWNPSQEAIASFSPKAKEWVTHFTALRSILQGYQARNVTPYMHSFAYHVPKMLSLYGNIKQFSGQGVEKNNDDSKCNLHSSNMHDGPSEILLTERRINHLSEQCERQKRQYQKKNTAYWDKGIREERAKKRRISIDPEN